MKNLLFIFFFCASAFASKVNYQLVYEGLDIVWGMDIRKDKMIISERDGDVKFLDLKKKKLTLINGGPEVKKGGQGGLLDIRFHPQFEKNSIVYFTYSKKTKDGATTALGRGKIEGSKLIDVKDLFVAKGKSSTRRHFGSRITFDGKGHLFISIGDRGIRESAQDLNSHFGKIIRLNLNGTIPKDNPFYNSKNYLPEIWSYGHRNPQGLFYDIKNQKLYEMEHGPRGGDEINIIEPGKNYGWPIISYGKEYWGEIMVGESTHKEGMEQPFKQYSPSIAPSGLIVKDDKVISGSLKLTHVNIFNMKTKKELRLFQSLGERVRNVILSHDNVIYFSTDSGKIYFIQD